MQKKSYFISIQFKKQRFRKVKFINHADIYEFWNESKSCCD